MSEEYKAGRAILLPWRFKRSRADQLRPRGREKEPHLNSWSAAIAAVATTKLQKPGSRLQLQRHPSCHAQGSDHIRLDGGLPLAPHLPHRWVRRLSWCRS